MDERVFSVRERERGGAGESYGHIPEGVRQKEPMLLQEAHHGHMRERDRGTQERESGYVKAMAIHLRIYGEAKVEHFQS